MVDIKLAYSLLIF